jgi:CubicO group peptidase (beta-lactamase class C family)
VHGDATSLGLDVSVLERHRQLCQRTAADACLVVYRGRIVQEWYGPRYARPMYAMSSTKSVTGLLVGMLIADGKIRGVDQRVCDFVPTWCTGIRGRVTLRHLLTMTSGLPAMPDSSVGFVARKNAFVMRLTPTAEPGTRWVYSNEGVQLLSPILTKVAGMPIQDYARRRLFAPLGMRDTRLHVSRGDAWTYADMETTPRDFARLGLLMLQRGVWSGRQIVPAEWIDASTVPSQTIESRYGLLWWLPDTGVVAARGHLDTDLHVLPGADLVAVRMQAKPAPGAPEGTYESLVIPLLRQIVPVPRVDSAPTRRAALDLSGPWATGSTAEPDVPSLVLQMPCNYSPPLWVIEQRGDTVRAMVILESRAQGIPSPPRARPAAAEGRISGVNVTMSIEGARYVLRYDSASGHLRGTLNGASFWAVRQELVRAEGCIPVP